MGEQEIHLILSGTAAAADVHGRYHPKGTPIFCRQQEAIAAVKEWCVVFTYFIYVVISRQYALQRQCPIIHSISLKMFAI